MITDGSDVGPEGHDPTSTSAETSTETSTETEIASGTTRKAPDADCPQVWFVAPAGQIPPLPNKICGPFRVSELKSFISTGELHSRALVTAAHVEDYASEDGGELSGVKVSRFSFFFPSP
tara:strand:+ start:509 stop:868 length:360 start_codon:yes stop_codon:yes gene_type:complete